MAVLNDDSRIISGLTFLLFSSTNFTGLAFAGPAFFNPGNSVLIFESCPSVFDLFDPSFTRVAFSVDQQFQLCCF